MRRPKKGPVCGMAYEMSSRPASVEGVQLVRQSIISLGSASRPGCDDRKQGLVSLVCELV